MKKETVKVFAAGFLSIALFSGLFVLMNGATLAAQANQAEVVDPMGEAVIDIPVEDSNGSDDHALVCCGEPDEPALYELSEEGVLELIEQHLQETFGEEITNFTSIDASFHRGDDFYFGNGWESGSFWYVTLIGDSGASIEDLHPQDPILFFDGFDFEDYFTNFPLFHYIINARTGEIRYVGDYRNVMSEWSAMRAGQVVELNPGLDFDDPDEVRQQLNGN